MKRSTALLAFLLILLLASLACSLPGAVETPPSPLPPTPPPAATDTPIPPPLPTETSAPPPPPTATEVAPTATLPLSSPEPPPTLIVVVTEIAPTLAPEARYLPGGFLTKDPSGDSLTFYNLQGRPIGSLNTPGMQYWLINSYVHVTGRMPDDGSLPAIVYFRYDPSPALMINDNEQISTLLDVPEFYNLAGAIGEPVVAYNTLGYENAGLRSRVYAGNLDTILSGVPVLDIVDPESWAVKPWAVVAEAGQPVGVWYTRVAYGIGGDIVFEPRRSLHYLNLANGDDLTYFGDTINPVGFSPDLTWVAYTAGYATGPVVIDNLYDAVSPVTIPLLSSSDRGAGDAFFSPDNQYVAWKEGSGWQMSEVPNFQATLRIANNLGAITAEISEASLAAAAGGDIDWMAPVGWLDSQTLIVEVRVGSWDNASLMQVRYDGSGLAYLAPGAFIDFFYP